VIDRSLARAALGVVVVVVVVVASSCGGGDDAVPETDEIVPSVDADAGDSLPDVELVALDGGESISLADIDGPAVVNLWATWCAPCRREIPDFEAVHRARGDQVRFVGINIGEDAEDAAEFIDDVGATYDQYLDSAGFVVTELRTATMPVTLVLAPDGTISTKHLGPMDQDDLDAAIDEALAA
jgi:cytochrome c biogenesis protein CcmG, thiol:disulfide interchange protein DsbE